MSEIDLFYGKEGPSPKQTIFREATERYKLFGGGVGGGKSRALCAEAIRQSLLYPGNRGFAGRNEAEAFRKTTLVTLLALIVEIENFTGQRLLIKNGHNQTKKEITFINGSMILYGGMSGPDADERIKSLEIGFFIVDEASECNEDVVNMLKARLRWKLPNDKYPRFFGLFASNPEPGWLKSTFVVPQQLGEPKPDHLFVQSLLKDNPWLPPNYLENLRRDNPESWVKRYVDGSWDAVEGLVWPEFNYEDHVFPSLAHDFEIPYPTKGEVLQFAALDHGQTNPTCFLGFYVDQDDNIFVFDEYYQKGLVSSHCMNIMTRFDVSAFEYICADPSMWGKTREKEGRAWSVFDEYDEYDIYLDKAQNDRAAGWNRVGEYLRTDPEHYHPILDKQGSPRLFISARCKSLLNEIPEYVWKKLREKDSNPKEEARKLNDHACDALRYGVMSRPSPYELKEKDQAPVGSFNFYKGMSTVGFKKGYMVNA